MKHIIAIVSLFMLVVHPANAEMRVWTSKKGDTVEAEFINVFGRKVVLKRADGKQLKVPMSGLCDADVKYITKSIPPEIEIEVDVDNDRKTLDSYSSDYGYYDYSKKAQKVKCEVTVTKKSRMQNSTPLTATIFVFSKDPRSDELRVILTAEKDFSFENQEEATFSTGTASLTITKSSSSYWSGSNDGAEYEGYVVCVEDKNGNIVGMRGSRNLYEECIGKIRGAKEGTRFDRDMDMINPPK